MISFTALMSANILLGLVLNCISKYTINLINLIFLYDACIIIDKNIIIVRLQNSNEFIS